MEVKIILGLDWDKIINVPLALQNAITANINNLNSGTQGNYIVTAEMFKSALDSAKQEIIGIMPDTLNSLKEVYDAISATEGADKQLLINLMEGKVSIADFNSAMASKADKSYVDGQLATKADTTALTAGLATKADTTALTAGLATKASNMDLATEIAGVQDLINENYTQFDEFVGQTNDALATKASISNLNNFHDEFDGLVDTVNTKADKTQVATDISTAKAEIKAEILGGAGVNIDTLAEIKAYVDNIKTYLENDENADVIALQALINDKISKSDLQVLLWEDITDPETDDVITQNDFDKITADPSLATGKVVSLIDFLKLFNLSTTNLNYQIVETNNRFNALPNTYFSKGSIVTSAVMQNVAVTNATFGTGNPSATFGEGTLVSSKVLWGLIGALRGDMASSKVIGEVKTFAGSVLPSGYMLCNGQSVLITDKPALFAVIGTTYGGNGTTHFNLPNLGGRSVVGVGDSVALGQTGGSSSVTLTVPNLPSHNHNMLGSSSSPNSSSASGGLLASQNRGGATMPAIYTTDTTNQVAMGSQTSLVGEATPIDVRNPFIGLQYIICAS